MTRFDRIATDAAGCHGKPTICGVRYPVHMLLELLASGTTLNGVLAGYPDLERDDLLAALADHNDRVVTEACPALLIARCHPPCTHLGPLDGGSRTHSWMIGRPKLRQGPVHVAMLDAANHHRQWAGRDGVEGKR